MSVAEETALIRKALTDFENKIEKMHLDFGKYVHGELKKLPDWENLERELLSFSKAKIYDLELANHLERILFKFQNRKRIWFRWLEQSRN